MIATDATLRLYGVEGVSQIVQPLQGPSGYKSVRAGASRSGPLGSCEVKLGPLYQPLDEGGANLDLLLAVYLPPLALPSLGRRRVMCAALRYTVAGSDELEVTWAEYCVGRPLAPAVSDAPTLLVAGHPLVQVSST